MIPIEKYKKLHTFAKNFEYRNVREMYVQRAGRKMLNGIKKEKKEKLRIRNYNYNKANYTMSNREREEVAMEKD